MVTFSGKKTMPLFFKITEIISTSLQKLKRLAKIMDFLLCCNQLLLQGSLVRDFLRVSICTIHKQNGDFGH
jgi:hypothetical protein